MSKANYKVDMGRIKPRFDKQFARAEAALTEQVLADSTRYVPRASGDLQMSGRAESRPGLSTVQWGGSLAPYARAQYYGYPNKNRTINKFASMQWFEQAKSAKGRLWAKMVKEIAGGGRQ